MTTSYVFVDSVNRQTPNSNSYTVFLTHELKNITRVDLVNVGVPNTVFNISNGTNILTCDGVSYSIPVGFYNANDLATSISKIIPHECDYIFDNSSFVFSNVTSSFVMSFNTAEIQLRMGFSSGALSSVNPSGTPYKDVYSGQTGILYSSQNADMSTSQFVFLDIEELRNDSLVDTKSKLNSIGNFSGNTVTRFFAPIPMDVQPGYIKTFSENKDFGYSIEFKTPLAKLSRLTIRWTDSNGQLLNFNGMERNSFLLRVYTENFAENLKDVRESKVPYVIACVILFLVFLLVSF